METPVNKAFRITMYEWFFLVFSILLCLLFLAFNPVTTPPDEIAHLAYPRFILEHRALPSFLTPEDAWESHQPPLYYLASIPIVALTKTSPFIAQITLNRLTSVIFFAIYFFSLIIFLKKLFPSKFKTQTIGLLLGLLPSIVYVGSSFANDIAALAFSMALLSIWAYLQESLSIKTTLLFGVVVGLTLLTKAHAYPVVAVLFLWHAFKKPWKHTLLVALISILVSGWWFIRNAFVVGDLFGLKHTFILWQGQDTAVFSFSSFGIFIGKLAQGMIGVFAKNSLALPLWLYALSLALFAFLIFASAKRKTAPKYTRAVLWCGFMATLAFVIWQSTKFYQPQGRYLLPAFPCLLAISLFGFENLSRRLRNITYAITIMCTVLLLVFSIKTLVDYKSSNPAPALSHKRNIDGLQLGWIGSNNRKLGEPIVFNSFKPLSTLADFRLLTERNPKVRIRTNAQKPLVLKLRWKELGDNRFTEDKKMIVSITTEALVSFPKKNPTLIQDLELSMLEGPLPIALTEFTITTD